MKSPLIKKGDLVEFTDGWHPSYPPAKQSLIKFGVAITDQQSLTDKVKVKMADGNVVVANYVHAYAWAGWTPDGLEDIVCELNHDPSDWDVID